MEITKFKSGNINVQRESNYDGQESLLSLLLNSCELDFQIAVDECGNEMVDQCVGNWDCSTELYNSNNDKCYSILGNDNTDFMSGKTIKLLAYSNCYNQNN